MKDVHPPEIASIFEEESAGRSNTNPSPFKETRTRIADILSVSEKDSKGLHVNLYRNLSRLGGKDDAPFVVLEWKLGDDLLSRTDTEFYSQDKVSREDDAVSKILEEARAAGLRAIVVALRDEPPKGAVERRFAALAYREDVYEKSKIDALAKALGLDEKQLTAWPAAKKAPATPGPAGGEATPAIVSNSWRPSTMLHANLVLEGVPGTGKTHWVKTSARKLFSDEGADIGALGDGDFAITLHPATSYEDFVEGLRPGHARPTLLSGAVKVDRVDVDPSNPSDGQQWFFSAVTPRLPKPSANDDSPTASSSGLNPSKPSFEVHDGFFLRACSTAVANPNKGYVVLLDEFNRCNVPKVFGDLLTTLEPSKRATWTPEQGWSTKHSQVVTLPYSGRRFFVPANIVVVATMNTTDRSITGLDGALRRRFAFERVWPLGFRTPSRSFSLGELLDEFGLDAPVVAEAETGAPASDSTTSPPSDGELSSADRLLLATIRAWGKMNEQLLKDFGPDGMLGHSYLFDIRRALDRDERYWHAEDPAETLREAWNKYLLPQLVEVFENGNSLSSVSIDMPVLKHLRDGLASVGTLQLEQPGTNALLRRINLHIWPEQH